MSFSKSSFLSGAPIMGGILLVMIWLANPGRVFGAFGLSSSTDSYTVDTGAGLVFKVRRTDNGSSTQSPGDLMSLVFNGVEYQNQSRGSHINSGFDWLYSGVSDVAVSADVINVNHIRITVQAGDLTHYYLARNGQPHIYMATYFTREPDTLNLCRFIVRIPATLLPNGPDPSDIRNNTGAIESGDIFGMADGTTRSKHYSNMRLLDWSHIGATGDGVGVFMVRSNHEGDSGGPFYRSLLNQTSEDQEITYIINYGQAQTEPFRTHVLNGPYALVFTGGGQPNTHLDYSWIGSNGLNLIGWVSKRNRGAIAGTVSGVSTGFEAVLGFANSQAQYWAVAGKDGNYITPLMLPGAYTATLYKQELAVATAQVVVTASATNALNLASLEETPAYIWKLGDWDGTPAGFQNADKVTTMHPSDARMSNWNPGTFLVGSSSPFSGVPCYQWKDVNPNLIIRFNLTTAQLVDSTVRIGITAAYSGARPKISVNAWSSGNPSPSTQPNTRTLTTGSYRGNNTLYTFDVPASALVGGQNILTVYPISGSGGAGFLSPGYSLDCLEWDGPVMRAPRTPAGLTSTAGHRQIALNWNPVPDAVTYGVKRAVAVSGPFLTIATDVEPARYLDAGLVNGTPYFYKISAINSMGESADSIGVSTTPSDFLGYWKFDETSGVNARDSTGTNDGTLVAGATWVPGRSGNAVRLEGEANGHVSFPKGLVSTLGNFTITAWVKVNSNGDWARVFDFGSGTDRYMFLSPSSGFNTVRYAITTNSIAGEQVIESLGVLSTGVWHHLAVTLAGTIGRLYLDGMEVGVNSNMTLWPSILGNTLHNYLGKSQWPDPSLDGTVDEFRIYTRALDASEIETLVTAPGTPGDLAATAGDAQAGLSWASVPDANTYNLKRATILSGPFTTVTNLASNHVIDRALSNGVWYYYVISAVNPAGESADSAPVSVRPVSSVPTRLVATFSANQWQLNWPPGHTGWKLQSQTNSPGSGLGGDWYNIPNSDQTNGWVMPVNMSNGSAFFRLLSPYPP